MSDVLEGGCGCGAARYQITLSGAQTLVCHCRDCQKHLGAPYSIFTVVPAAQFHWMRRPSGRVAFSEHADRLFCKSCGTYLKYESKDQPDEAEVNAMTLDNPAAIVVDEEIFTRSRLGWIDPVAGARQYEAGRSV